MVENIEDMNWQKKFDYQKILLGYLPMVLMNLIQVII
jgi:hypothetical protein